MTHSVDGIIAKMIRADEHIELLDTEISAFLDAKLYRAVGEADANTSEAIFRAVGPEPPLRFAVIAGEIVHQLRSALDHLVWQLVLRNGNTPNRAHQFPICDTFEQYVSACHRGRMKGITAAAEALIQGLQPFHKGQEASSHPLYILREMDITDKHCLLVVVAAVASLDGIGLGSDRADLEIVGLGEPQWPVRPTEHGTEMLRVQFGGNLPADMKLEDNIKAHIILERFGPYRNQPVVPSVRQLRDKVVHMLTLFGAELPGLDHIAAPSIQRPANPHSD